MNLMFYNFNEFNINQPAQNGRRPTAGTANGKRPIVNQVGAHGS